MKAVVTNKETMRKFYFYDVVEIKESNGCFLLTLEDGTTIGYTTDKWSYKKEDKLNECY